MPRGEMKVKIRKAIILMALILFVTPPIAQAQEIFDAIRNGDQAKVKELIEKDPEFLKAKNANLSTPLHVAADVDNEPITRYLIEKGAGPNATNRSKNTPLNYVKSTDVTKLLIERGADINAQNSSLPRTNIFGSPLLWDEVLGSIIQAALQLLAKRLDKRALCS